MFSPIASIKEWWSSLRAPESAPAQEVTHIRAGMELRGVIHANAGSAVMVEGVQHGDIYGAQVVFVAAGGKVDGSVHAEEVIVAGEVDGEVHAAQRTEVHATGVIVGLVHTKAALFLEGARVNGTVRIGEPVRLASRGGVRTLTPAVSVTPSAAASSPAAQRSTTRVSSGNRSGSATAPALKPLALDPVVAPVSVTPLRPAASADVDAEVVVHSSYRMTL
jgi:cytoskeletal protein CcmA (bactofilin family)